MRITETRAVEDSTLPELNRLINEAIWQAIADGWAVVDIRYHATGDNVWAWYTAILLIGEAS